MAIKDILLHLNSYPTPTPVRLIEQAVDIAELLRARVSALTLQIEFHVPRNFLANAALDIPSIIATERSKSVANGRDLLASFETVATKRRVPHGHVVESGTTTEAPDIITEYARLYDLTILPLQERTGFEPIAAESVIFESGRPVIILPPGAERSAPVRLETIGVAWDFSRPAARAVADALPLLERASTVRVLTVTNDRTINTRRSGSELARHLAAHGVKAIFEEEDAAGRSVASAVESYAAAHKLDLLVMGAYGHSRIRDFILGGVTKSMVAKPALPVLLSH